MANIHNLLLTVDYYFQTSMPTSNLHCVSCRNMFSNFLITM